MADGVGGWARNNVNPKDFADDLMKFTMEAIIQQNGKILPVPALDYAYEKVEQTGSCTAVVGILGSDDYLRVANIGDSGIMIIRDGEIVFKTEEQQHGFNFPYQLGKVEGRDGKYYTHGQTDQKMPTHIHSLFVQEMLLLQVRMDCLTMFGTRICLLV